MTPTNDATGPAARPKYGQYANAADQAARSGNRPQYGQYATPEEQRASIKEPDKYFEEFQAAALRPHGNDAEAPASAAPTGVGAQDHGRQESDRRATPAEKPPAGQASASASVAHHPVDRVVTFILLALGLFFTVSIVPGMLHPADSIEASYKQFGIGSYTPTGLTQVVGIGVAFVFIVGWLFAAFSSMARLRAGKYGWWIPAVVGVAVWILTMIGFAALMVTDPTFMNYATSAK